MLSVVILQRGFNKYLNPKNFNSSPKKVASNWTSIFEEFYLGMKMPIPGISNANLYPSLKIFEAGLLATIRSQQIVPQFEVLIKNLHLGVCTGVDMTGIYKTTPPSVPLSLQSCFNSKLSNSQMANLMSSRIMRYVNATFSTIIISGTIIKWI